MTAEKKTDDKKPDVTIRRMRIDDLDAMQALYAQQMEADTDPLSALRVTPKQHAFEMRRLRQQWLAVQRYFAYVASAEIQGKEVLVGYIAAVIESQARLYAVENVASIGELWVEPEHRARGIGRALAEELLNDFANHEIDWITVHLSNDVDNVIDFFKKFGFVQSAVEMRCQISELAKESLENNE